MGDLRSRAHCRGGGGKAPLPLARSWQDLQCPPLTRPLQRSTPVEGSPHEDSSVQLVPTVASPFAPPFLDLHLGEEVARKVARRWRGDGEEVAPEVGQGPRKGAIPDTPPQRSTTAPNIASKESRFLRFRQPNSAVRPGLAKNEQRNPIIQAEKKEYVIK